MTNPATAPSVRSRARSLVRVLAHALARAAALTAVCAVPSAQAVDTAWSGYATLGYARSDSPYTQQRFIGNQGSWKRDSVVAGQLDLRLAPAWSATVQMKLAPANDHDERWRARASWAFVGWRPDDDWLLRAGRLRVPLYLHSESLDVGVSHDMARLPHEMYSIAPTNDFDGVYLSRAFALGEREFSLDAYGGQTRTAGRFWSRDGLPPVQPPGPLFLKVRVDVVGLVLTARERNLTWRLGMHATRTRPADGAMIATTFPRVDLGPGIAYWQVDNSLPGPGVPMVSRIRNQVLTGGAEWQIGRGWRVTGEFVRMRQRDTELGSDSLAGYLALFKTVGNFTPYVSVARQQSSDGLREWHRRLTGGGLPASLPGAAQVNAAQRLASESLYAFDQRSVALGVSYALSPTAKLKAEWMRTRVGEVSNHFDTPSGLPDLRDQHVDALSLNLSVAF